MQSKSEVVQEKKRQAEAVQSEKNKTLLKLCANRDERVRISSVNDCLVDGADPSAIDENGNCALVIALENQNEHVAEFLLKKGANPLYKNRNQLTVLDFVSISSPLFSLIQDKIKEYSLRQETAANRVGRLNKEFHEEVDSIAPKVRKIKSLLDQGAQINHQSLEDGYTALMLAVDAQNDRIAEYLLNQGADPSIRNKSGELARNLTSVNSPIYSLLKEKERVLTASKLPPKHANSFLLQEYINGPDVRAQKIEEYLELGADINYQNATGWTVLIIMVEKGNEFIAEFLLKAGANPLLKNKRGKIASDYASQNSAIYSLLKGYELLSATRSGDIVTVQQILARNGALLNFQDQRGYSGLLLAVEQGFFELAEHYLSCGADSTLRRDDGLDVAELAPNEEMCGLISKFQNSAQFEEEKIEDIGEEQQPSLGGDITATSFKM